MNTDITNEHFKNRHGTGDIRLCIKVTANQSFPLFYQITTEEGGFVFVDWGDGNEETFTDATEYSPKHTYAKAGEYVVKLTGSKFTGVIGNDFPDSYTDFQNAVREILSLKMPTDSTSVSLRNAFYDCTKLIGSIPEWDDCITNVNCAYEGCSGLTGNVPEWGANITNASCTYWRCTGLTGKIPEWGTKIKVVDFTYWGCNSLTGNIPAWGANIASAYATYQDCIGLTGCSEELLQDPMPSKITSHGNCVFGCVDAIRQHFTKDWGRAE